MSMANNYGFVTNALGILLVISVNRVNTHALTKPYVNQIAL